MRDKKYIRYALFASVLLALGPILWLFINLYAKNYERIVSNLVSVLVGITLVCYNLRNYLKVYNKKSNIVLELLRHIVSFAFFILLIAVMVVASIELFNLIAILQEKLFVKEGYIMYLIKYPYSYLFYVILIILAYKLIMFLSKEKFSFRGKVLSLWFKKDKFLLVAIMLFIYLILTSVVVITKDGIYDYSFYNLKGNKYNFGDVKYVHTGFGGKGGNKGEFFYNIRLKDGKKIKLAYPSMAGASEKYDGDSWQEYVDIDKYIMNGGAKKDSSEQNAKYARLDKKYVDKLLGIVRNK